MKNYNITQKIIFLFIILSSLGFIVFGFVSILAQSQEEDVSVLGLNEVIYSGTSKIFPDFETTNTTFPLGQMLRINKPAEIFIKQLNIKIVTSDLSFEIGDKNIILNSGILFIESRGSNDTDIIINNKSIKLLNRSKLIINLESNKFYVLEGTVVADNGQVIERDQSARWIVDSWSIDEFLNSEISLNSVYDDLEFTLWNLDYEL